MVLPAGVVAGCATAVEGWAGSAAAIAAGDGYTVALKSGGRVIAWGDDDFGQATVPVEAQSGVTAIAAGRAHTVALKNDGSVITWGDNSSGQTMLPPGARSGVAAIAASSLSARAAKLVQQLALLLPEFIAESCAPPTGQLQLT